MTILGAIVRPDHALVWIDSEIYAGVEPSGRFNKLRFAACGPVVGFGAGWHDLLCYADAAVCDAGDVDEAATLCSAALRQHMVRLTTTTHAREPDQFGGQLSVVAGWSPLFGRMLAYRLTGASLFSPVLVSRIASPYLDDFNGFSPYTDDQVTGFARRQIDALREHCPAATGGDLVIATLTAAGTFIRSVREFARPAHASLCEEIAA